jgi:hypothetical protein
LGNQDPSETWYQGEIGFFDFYVIPLAKKLDTCGVFGVSSDELLNYAEANRKEWETKGKEIVQSYLRTHQEILERSALHGSSGMFRQRLDSSDTIGDMSVSSFFTESKA